MRTLLIILFGFLCIKSTAQKVIKIDIFYLPWDIRFDLKVSPDELRNEEWKATSICYITEDSVMNEFLQAMAIFNLRPFEAEDYIDPVYVIDVYLEGYKTKKTVILGNTCNPKYEGKYYFRNIVLQRWIEKYIPKATFPIGTKQKKVSVK